MAPILQRVRIPGIFVTGTDTGVGKTLVAGAIADWFVRTGIRTAVCKPCATGCDRQGEMLLSADARFLARCARTGRPLEEICPQRYFEALAPAVAAQRTGRPLDWSSIDRSIAAMSAGAGAIVIEGIGGIMVPMDERHTVLDMAAWLGLPAVVVARAGLGTINHTLLTVGALRRAGVSVGGVVLNRFTQEVADLAEETNPAAIAHWGKVAVLARVPDLSRFDLESPALPEDVVASVSEVDWLTIAQNGGV